MAGSSDSMGAGVAVGVAVAAAICIAGCSVAWASCVDMAVEDAKKDVSVAPEMGLVPNIQPMDTVP